MELKSPETPNDYCACGEPILNLYFFAIFMVIDVIKSSCY